MPLCLEVARSIDTFFCVWEQRALGFLGAKGHRRWRRYKKMLVDKGSLSHFVGEHEGSYHEFLKIEHRPMVTEVNIKAPATCFADPVLQDSTLTCEPTEAIICKANICTLRRSCPCIICMFTGCIYHGCNAPKRHCCDASKPTVAWIGV